MSLSIQIRFFQAPYLLELFLVFLKGHFSISQCFLFTYHSSLKYLVIDGISKADCKLSVHQQALVDY